METLPERQDPIRSFLSWFMSGEDVVRYSDLSYVLETIKKDDLCWQAAVSIGVHVLVFGFFGQTDQEKALAGSLVGRAIEPLEALHEHLTRQAGQQPLTDDQARMLFHVRWALAFVFYERGDRQRAMGFLHEMAATQLSRFGGAAGSGRDIVTYTDDMRQGKELAARLMSTLCTEMDNYTETLSVITRAADVTGDPLALLGQASDLLDRWAARCEAIEQREGADELDAFLEWTTLLYSAAEVVSVCQQVDTSGVLPGECDKASPQFLAYKLGQLAARFAAKNTDLWHHFLDEVEEEPGRLDFLVEALLCEHELGRDWQKVRDRYLAGWRRTPCYEGTSPEEIGPHMDLYWAMRIGFADKMLEFTGALVPAQAPAPPPDTLRDIETIKEVVTMIAIRQVKEQRDREQRLPPTREAMEQCLRERLGDVWDNLPSDVTDPLLSAECDYQTGWQRGIPTRQVAEGFYDAVQACFQAYFVDRLIASLGTGPRSIRLSYRGWRGRWEEHEVDLDNPTSLSVRAWASVLETVADPEQTGRENLQVKQFVKRSCPTLGPDPPKALADLLRKVQDYRNAAVHRRWPPGPHRKERAELDDMRDLVLGTAHSPSVVVQIYRLFGPSKQP